MWRAFKVEVKHIIFKSFFHLVRFGGLLLMPLIYAFSYIFAFYDPFDKTDQLPIKLYVAQSTNNKNKFGKALAKVLSDTNRIEVGELHMNLKMDAIYVDPKDSDVQGATDQENEQRFLNAFVSKSQNEFATIYMPNFSDDMVGHDKTGAETHHDGLDKIMKSAIDAATGNLVDKATLVGKIISLASWIASNDLDEQHKIQVFNNQQKNYLLGFGIGIGADMSGSSTFIINALLKAAQDNEYLKEIGIQPHAIKEIQNTLSSSTFQNRKMINLKSQMGGEHAKYGYGLAPFFICVSMWIGSMVMTFAVHRKIFDFKVTAGVRYFVKWVIIALGIVVQATLVMASLYFVGFDKLGLSHWGAMYGFSILIGLIFTSVVQGIRYCIYERSLGLFLIIILLVLQMASAGGLFPIDTQSQFYQVLNKILPMTHGVNIIREVSFDTNWSAVMNETGYLLLYLFLVPLAVYINQRRTIKTYLNLGKTLPLKMQTKLARSLADKHKGGKHV